MTGIERFAAEEAIRISIVCDRLVLALCQVCCLRYACIFELNLTHRVPVLPISRPWCVPYLELCHGDSLMSGQDVRGKTSARWWADYECVPPS